MLQDVSHGCEPDMRLSSQETQTPNTYTQPRQSSQNQVQEALRVAPGLPGELFPKPQRRFRGHGMRSPVQRPVLGSTATKAVSLIHRNGPTMRIAFGRQCLVTTAAPPQKRRTIECVTLREKAASLLRRGMMLLPPVPSMQIRFSRARTRARPIPPREAMTMG